MDRMTGEELLATLTTMRKKQRLTASGWFTETPSFLVEYLNRPGKGLRPLLFWVAYLMASHWERQNRQSLYELLAQTQTWNVANKLEQFHIAAMALDDCFDGATERRGGPALHLLFEGWAKGQGWYSSGYPLRPPCATSWVTDVLIHSMLDLWQSLLTAVDLDSSSVNRYRRLAGLTHHSHGTPPKVEWIVERLQEVINCLRDHRTELQVVGPTYELLDTCLQTFQRTLDGELIDLAWAKDGKVPRLQELHSLQELKTTWYSIILPLRAGMMLGCPDNHVADVLRHLDSYARDFGTAFQIQDDLLVLEPEGRTRKSSRRDLEQRSMTSATVMTYWKLREKDRPSWIKLLDDCRGSPPVQESALQFIRQQQVPDECQRLIGQKLASCHSTLESLRQHGFNPDLIEAIAHRGLGWMDDDPLGSHPAPAHSGGSSTKRRCRE